MYVLGKHVAAVAPPAVFDVSTINEVVGNNVVANCGLMRSKL